MMGLLLCAHVIRLHFLGGTQRVEEKIGIPTSNTEVEGANGRTVLDLALHGEGRMVSA